MSAMLLKVILGIVFIISGGTAFSNSFRQHKILFSAAATLSFVSGIYLLISINDDVVGYTADKRITTDIMNTNGVDRVDSVYRQAPPLEMSKGDTWGKFQIDRNCILRYGNAAIHGFSRNGKDKCSYTPLFSASPSGRYVLVFSPTSNYGYDRIAIVDVSRNELIMNSSSVGDERLLPSGLWSEDEEFTVVGKWFVTQESIPHEPGGGVSILSGFMPCVFNVKKKDIYCPNQNTYANPSISKMFQISVENNCFIKKTCAMISAVDGGTWDANENRFKVYLSFNAMPTSAYRSIFGIDNNSAYYGHVFMEPSGEITNMDIKSHWR